MKIYIVVEFHCGNQYNRAVYSTRADAEQVCEALSSIDNHVHVEEWDVDRMTHVDGTWWYILLSEDGKLLDAQKTDFVDAEGTDCNYVDGPFRTYVEAPTQAEAIKIAQQRWRDP